MKKIKVKVSTQSQHTDTGPTSPSNDLRRHTLGNVAANVSIYASLYISMCLPVSLSVITR